MQGFHDGRLSVKRQVPPELASVAVAGDPGQHVSIHYPLDDSAWIRLHRLHDLSYYKGEVYLYFGVTPALLLSWPWYELTGHYLSHKDAVLIFCVVGFVASVGLLSAVWRRYFAEVGVGVVGAGALALGLANFMPALLSTVKVYEVPISCGYALTMLALGALWLALHAMRGRVWWLAGASLAYGLAVGARPILVFGAAMLLLPAIQAWREQRRVWSWLLAATAPSVLIVLGLMLYNFLRFDDPLEFGQRYQLPVSVHQQFSPAFLWFNLRVEFLEPARWTARSPFMQDIAVPPFPGGYFDIGHAFGMLTNVPLVWLALAAPLAWRNSLKEPRPHLFIFAGGVALLSGACALILSLHDSMHLRYEMEYASPLVLLSVVGIFGLERILAGWPVWRRVTRCGWSVLLALSVIFNLLVSISLQAEIENGLAISCLEKGQVNEAITHFQMALKVEPDNPKFRTALALALLDSGQMDKAVAHLRRALAIQPDNAEGHYSLAGALARQKKMGEAVTHLHAALKNEPGYAAAANDLAWILATDTNTALRNVEQAVRWAQRACELTTNQVASYLDTLGVAYSEAGRFKEAVEVTERAVANAIASGDREMAKRIKSRVDHYRAGRAYHVTLEGSGS